MERKQVTMSLHTATKEDKFCLIVELNNFDNLETEPLLKTSIGSAYTEQLLYSQKDSNFLIETNRKDDPKLCLNEEPPADKYDFAALIVFFAGIVCNMPASFFLVANDFWMYKFRDTNEETYNLMNKTDYQTIFVSMKSVGTAFPYVLSTILSILFSHKFDIRKRFLFVLGSVSIIFILFTLLTNLNTDMWQPVFFGLSLAVIAITSLFQPFYALTLAAFNSKFSTFYVKVCILGGSVSGLISSILQLVSLSIGNNSTQIALIYFSCGTLIMVFTFCLIYNWHYSPTIQYYLEGTKAHGCKLTYSITEYWETAKKIWFLLVLYFIFIATGNLGHPNITNLVVSEDYSGTGKNLWYDKYFVVTATYLLSDVCHIVGRFCGPPIIKRKNATTFIILSIARCLILFPLLWFCNIQPRHNLPILFPHDYQYMIILASLGFSGSVLETMTFLSVPVVAEDKAELGYILVMVTILITTTIASPLSPLYVKLL